LKKNCFDQISDYPFHEALSNWQKLAAVESIHLYPTMVLELVGGALLSAFLRVAFEKLASPQILHFFHARELDQKLLNKLEIKLHSIDSLADDAERKQFTDPHIRNWLLNVKDAVLNAEDLLDDIQKLSK